MKCENHPDRDGTLIGVRRILCLECAAAQQLGYTRAYATGLGREAHREAQEAGRYDREFQQGKANAKLRKYL